MSVRLNVVLSDDLNAEIDAAAAETETTKSEIFRKAIQLYLAARDGKKRGMKIGLARPDQPIETEFVGL